MLLAADFPPVTSLFAVVVDPPPPLVVLLAAEVVVEEAPLLSLVESLVVRECNNFWMACGSGAFDIQRSRCNTGKDFKSNNEIEIPKGSPPLGRTGVRSLKISNLIGLIQPFKFEILSNRAPMRPIGGRP